MGRVTHIGSGGYEWRMTPDHDAVGGGDTPAPHHQRPGEVDDSTVEAVGKLTEALETVERARGHLYSFHQLTGAADLELGEAVDGLREAGHTQLADEIEAELIGLNVIQGRWTFQIVEDYDDGYYATSKALEATVREDLMRGQRHVYEAELKAQRRTPGRSGHEAAP